MDPGTWKQWQPEGECLRGVSPFQVDASGSAARRAVATILSSLGSSSTLPSSCRLYPTLIADTTGCYHAPLKHQAYFSCLSSPTPNTPISLQAPYKRTATFVGDSTVRQLFFAVVRLVDGGKGAVPPDWVSEGEKHSDRRLTFYENAGSDAERAVELEFIW